MAFVGEWRRLQFASVVMGLGCSDAVPLLFSNALRPLILAIPT